MSDLRLSRTTEWDFDLEFTGEDLVIGDDLETAVVVSLFTWARRAADDPDPTPGSDPMGWWADETLEDANDFLGSKWWLAEGSKITPDLFMQVGQWGQQALAWMLEDKVADRVEILPERSTIQADRVDVLVRIIQPAGAAVEYRYRLNWEAQASRRTP
jgi:phage gp46-like protein